MDPEETWKAQASTGGMIGRSRAGIYLGGSAGVVSFNWAVPLYQTVYNIGDPVYRLNNQAKLTTARTKHSPRFEGIVAPNLRPVPQDSGLRFPFQGTHFYGSREPVSPGSYMVYYRFFDMGIVTTRGAQGRGGFTFPF